VLSGLPYPDLAPLDSPLNDLHFQPMIVAGDPNGSPSDSPANRVDPNSATSPFDGVGSLEIRTRRGTYICTGTPVDSTHVVTAAHCLDINGDGRSNSKDGITAVYFILNDGGNTTSRIKASSWVLHPDFTGFNRPSVNDDVSVITLGTAVPAGTTTYDLFGGNLAGAELHMVGYGQSGNGVSGYTVNASFNVKRHGMNTADAFYGQDDAGKPAADEVFRFDFDAPDGSTGSMGGASLGNDLETTLGGGDSGGPSFVLVGSAYQLAGINTFTQGTTAPKFGSLGGGMAIGAYDDWIVAAIAGTAAAASGDSGGGNGGKNHPDSEVITILIDLELDLQDCVDPSRNLRRADSAEGIGGISDDRQFVAESPANDGIDWLIGGSIDSLSSSRSPIGRSILAGAKTRLAESLELELALRDQVFAEWRAIL